MAARGFRKMALWLAPLPFLMGMLFVALAFWQNDADFALGHVTEVQARLLDAGPPHYGRGKPRYFPLFQQTNGQLLPFKQPLFADEMPPAKTLLTLRCSTRQPGLCKLPGTPVFDPLFYGIGGAWSVFALTLTGVLWRRAYLLSRPSR